MGVFFLQGKAGVSATLLISFTRLIDNKYLEKEAFGPFKVVNESTEILMIKKKIFCGGCGG